MTFCQLRIASSWVARVALTVAGALLVAMRDAASLSSGTVFKAPAFVYATMIVPPQQLEINPMQNHLVSKQSGELEVSRRGVAGD